ncbi:MAG: hypothetical protein IRY99_05145 [Isosphaeraceae bacterium]|nr:hypothetical protein [Isosphaeraceae bacterium]
MKRTFAVVALLAALGVLLKLAVKEAPRPESAPIAAPAVGPPAPDPAEALRAKYPERRDLVERTLRLYRHNALEIERTDGLRGLALLDRLGFEAIYLYEKYPDDFRRLRDCLTDEAAADLLLHWREYFALKRSDETDRAILIAEIARLTPAQRRAASKYPNALPLILAEPVGMTELIARWKDDPEELGDALAVLDFITLEHGAADLRAALRTLDAHGPLALEAFRLQGPEGFALVGLYGPVLDALGDALPLDQALILLRVNTDYIDELLRTQRPEVVAGHLRHVAAAGLVEAVGGSPHALRLVVEFGERGEKALAHAGPDAADVVFEEFTDPILRIQAVAALAEHGPMALAMLAKYAADPDFREVLRSFGPPVIPPIAAADSGPETLALLRARPNKSFKERLAQGVLALSGDSGQATIRRLKTDGLERVAELNAAELKFYQFLPLYDLVHLGSVASRGYWPTMGEMTWALVDGCFVVVDVLSLAAVQPEGVAASEAVRAEVKAATRQALRATGRELTEEAGEAVALGLARRGAVEGAEAAERLAARWWVVRLSGGTYQVLRRLPEALGRLGLPDLAELGRPLCAKAGLRLTAWTPRRIFKAGTFVPLPIPPERGLKYLAAQGLQASVGVVAFHKMEEHLQSRRPEGP